MINKPLDEREDITGLPYTSHRLSPELMSQALEQTADIVLVTNKRGIIKYVNPAFEQTTGYSKKEIVGCSPGILRSGEHNADFYRNLWKTISHKNAFRSVVVNRCKSGRLYHEEKTITPLINESGVITHYISTGKDVSARIKTEKKLQQLAYFDQLTGLPNRLQLRNYLFEAISQAVRRNEIFAVLFLDLDRFKDINDALGHDEGDKVLCEAGSRLRECLRIEDMVARSGGDEFIILLKEVGSENDVARVAEKILKKFTEPFKVKNHDHIIGVSIGISIFPNDYQTAKDLLKAADMAMYQAKKSSSKYKFFSSDMETRVVQRIKLERDIKIAVAKNEFVNFYQPQYDLLNGQLVGAEALVRWQHPERNLIGPNEFIPVAEYSGDIVLIGYSVLQKSCEQFVRWKEHGLELMSISVNLSPSQLNQNIYKQVSMVMQELDMKKGELTLELTESALMQHPDKVTSILTDLKSLGTKLSIDDFGTGYSSLSHLQHFPLDCLKIDRSFISDIPHNQDSVLLVKAIIGMAHSLKMKVVAEGVETEDQLMFLKSEGCDSVQGYLLGKPMPESEFFDHSRNYKCI